MEPINNTSNGFSIVEEVVSEIDFSFNNLSLNDSSEQTVVNKINDRNIRNVVQQEHTKSEVFDLSLEDNDIMGEYTVLDNNFEIDKSTYCTNMYDTKSSKYRFGRHNVRDFNFHENLN